MRQGVSGKKPTNAQHPTPNFHWAAESLANTASHGLGKNTKPKVEALMAKDFKAAYKTIMDDHFPPRIEMSYS